MSGLTWLHISDWLSKGEKEFDLPVIRAALIRDIVLEKLPSEIEKPSGSEEGVHRKT